MLTGKNIILGICGGIAAYKTPHLVRLLKRSGANVRVVMTASAGRFVSELALATVSGEPVLQGMFDNAGHAGSDATMHISLGEWADAFIIAPATANTIARLGSGLCDDMLTVCFITLRPGKPVLIVPAMDGYMFGSPSVQRNLATLAAQGCSILDPERGDLASGQCGLGRMPEPETIADTIAGMLSPDSGRPHSSSQLSAAPHSFTPDPGVRHFTASHLAGRHLIVTAGPTREKIDDVRFLSNYSSGKMGFAIAAAAAQRGAMVRLITGPVALATPAGVERIDVESAIGMLDAARNFFDECDIFIGAAAVADYRPEFPLSGKIKKREQSMQIRLVKNPDILAEFALSRTPSQIAVGFALETEGGLANAREKLEDKRLDMIAFNIYDRKTSGFEVDTNVLTLIDRNGTLEELPLMQKADAAGKVLDAIERLLAPQHQEQARHP